MKEKELIHIANGFLQRLRKYRNAAVVKFDADSIHMFRVEYKRLRAFGRMLSQRKKKSNRIRVSKSLKCSYAIAGEIRDLQLQQERLKAQLTSHSVSSKNDSSVLHKAINDLKPKLRKSFLKKPIGKTQKKILPKLPRSFVFKHFKIFVNTKMVAVRSILLHKQISELDLHNIRKHLKDFYYNLQLTEGPERKELLKLVNLHNNEKQLKELLHTLGLFQDKCAAIALLKKTKGLLTTEVKLHWNDEKKALKQQLIAEFRENFVQLPVV